MDEIHKNQEAIIETIERENDRYDQMQSAYDLDSLISKARQYQDKLLNIKKDMLIVKDKTIRLRRKAVKIIEDKNKEALELQRNRERNEILERHLEPVVNTNTPT